jgi:hypothetical protein
MKLLKKKVQTFAPAKRDRGLLIKGALKAQKSSEMPGPAAYNTFDNNTMMEKLRKSTQIRSPGRNQATSNMSRASREVSFTKFASINAKIYANGLL